MKRVGWWGRSWGCTLALGVLWHAAARAEPEIDVNQELRGIQQSAAVGVDGAGNFVVAWQSEIDGSDEIRARRFAPEGVARGDEFQINTLTAGHQDLPAIAVGPAGSFVVVWQSLIANQFQIRARRFDANGSALGDELAVSTRRNDTHGAAKVALDARGDFVVVWESPIHGSYEIRARRYDAAAQSFGAEFAVNTRSASSQRSPALALNARGQFVVVWRSNIAGSFEIRARRFDALAQPLDDEFAVNVTLAGDQLAPAVGIDARGNFVVAWENALDDRFEIRSRRFSAKGLALGAEAQVSAAGAGSQFAPALAMAASGEFCVAWQSRADGAGVIVARAFAANGAPRAEEVEVSTGRDGVHKGVSAAMNAGGDIALSWHRSSGQDWEIAARTLPQRALRRAAAAR